MQITSPTPLAAPAPVSTTQPSDNSQRESRFANLLRQNQAPTAPRAVPRRAEAAASTNTPPAPPTAADPGEAPETPAAPASNTKLRARPTEKPAPAKRAEGATKPAEQAASSAPSEAAPNAERSNEPATTASLNPWLASLQRHAEMPAATAGAGGQAAPARDPADSTDTAAISGARTNDAPSTANGANRDGKAVLPEARKASRDGSEHAGAQTPVAPAADPLAALHAATKGDAERAQTVPAAGTPAAPGVFVPQAAGSADAAAPVAVQLATPLTSPDFAQTLGVQMSVLASAGVQQAELHLNPAEMGPVSVQIVIDGTQAQVDFGADHAATRHAIEAGLPELAGALRDAGFTLTGGGVSQHSRGHGDGRGGEAGQHGGGPRTIAAGAGATDGAAPRVMRRTVSAGGVDLYA